MAIAIETGSSYAMSSAQAGDFRLRLLGAFRLCRPRLPLLVENAFPAKLVVGINGRLSRTLRSHAFILS
jgi:hypothetical protein